MSQNPIDLAPDERVQFKFLHFTPGNVEWEDGPNRLLDIPSGSTDVYLQGRFNGDCVMCLSKPGGLVATDDAEDWRQRHESVRREIAT